MLQKQSESTGLNDLSWHGNKKGKRTGVQTYWSARRHSWDKIKITIRDYKFILLQIFLFWGLKQSLQQSSETALYIKSEQWLTS
jgi:hypothetical protein